MAALTNEELAARSLADAAAAQLRCEEAKRVLDELVAEQGPTSAAAIAEVRRQWPED